jgi:Uma2 family endonuclease
MVTSTLHLAEQIAERLQTEEMIRIPATLDEFWEVVHEFGEEPGIELEYLYGKIKAQNGVATDNHELMVTNVASILRAAFYELPNVRVMVSNKTVYIPACQTAVKPDLVVMREPSQLFPRKGQEPAITNPYVVVEIYSESTQKDDRGEKLRCYKLIESLQHIIYLDPFKHHVSVYTKNGDVYHWYVVDYYSLDKPITLGEVTLNMRDVYHKISF